MNKMKVPIIIVTKKNRDLANSFSLFLEFIFDDLLKARDSAMGMLGHGLPLSSTSCWHTVGFSEILGDKQCGEGVSHSVIIESRVTVEYFDWSKYIVVEPLRVDCIFEQRNAVILTCSCLDASVYLDEKG